MYLNDLSLSFLICTKVYKHSYFTLIYLFNKSLTELLLGQASSSSWATPVCMTNNALRDPAPQKKHKQQTDQ